MKLHTAILKTIIDIPEDNVELRKVLDDVGLEVKGVQDTDAGTVFTIETLANRGDHLSALGVARELSARWLTSVRHPRLAADISTLRPSIGLRVTTPLCNRVALLELSGSVSQRSEIIAALGDAVHPDLPMVDISNYLQLEMGHPTHAFDLDTIEGDIVIDVTDKEERVIALDGKEYVLPIGSVVHRDRKKIIDVAGIIGCANTMVTKNTKRFLVEAASFDPIAIRKTARAMGISTDASYAFERGADRDCILTVLRRFLALAQTGAGANDTVQVHALTYFAGPATEQRSVPLNLATVRKQLNLPRLNEAEIQARLKALGFQLKEGAEKHTLEVLVPSWRLWDVEKEEDLIEDVARAISLNQVKIELPPLDYYPPEPSALEQIVYKLEPVLHGLGYFEVMTKSLYAASDVELLARYDPVLKDVHVATKNAIENNCSHLKATNVPSLARLFEKNLRRGVESFKVYETARLFREKFEKQGHPYEREFDVLTFAVGGRLNATSWRKPENIEEVFSFVSGTLQSFSRALRVPLTIATGSNKLLHPGRQASLKIGKTIVGYFGEIHPGLAKDLEISQPLIVGELDLFLVSGQFSDRGISRPVISDYPSVARDLTLKVVNKAWASQVVETIRKLNIETIHQILIVDDFKKQEEDFRRVSFRIVFQSPDRTLTSGEVELAFAKIIEQLDSVGFSLAV